MKNLAAKQKKITPFNEKLQLTLITKIPNLAFFIIVLFFVSDSLLFVEIKNQVIKNFIYYGILVATPFVLIWNIFSVKPIAKRLVLSLLPVAVLILVLVVGPARIIFSSAAWQTQEVLYKDRHSSSFRIELQRKDAGALGYKRRTVKVRYITPLFMTTNELKDEILNHNKWIKIDTVLTKIAVRDSIISHKVEKNFRFEDFAVATYKGKLAKPVFRGSPFSNDSEYVKFISNGCKEKGINFCGYYTIIEKSCGTMCSHLFMVNRKNGKVLDKGVSVFKSGRYGYAYRKDSRLLVANSSLFIDSLFTLYEESVIGKPEFYKWENEKLIEM